jgi:hypothetical protein
LDGLGTWGGARILERWQLLAEGEAGKADLGVTFWAGRKCRWAVTSVARNTRTAIAVARGSDPWLNEPSNKPLKLTVGRLRRPPAA